MVSFEQARQLVQFGHQVTVVSSQTQGETLEEKIDGVRIRRVKAFNFVERQWGIPYPLFYPSLTKTLKREI